MIEENTEVDREFQDIYHAFYEKIRRYLTRLVGESEAEDLTQEVFLKASRALHSFEGKSQISTWLFRIATNTALDRLRNKSDRNTVSGEDLYGSAEEEAEWAAEQATSPEQAVIQKEMNHCIRDIVETLPENYRVALSLSELEGFSNKEIAEITGTSVDTVKIRLYRARRKLKQKLSLQCDFYRNEQNEFACDQKSKPIKFP
jgi:RNA polymerase sigma-70 factor (ECF subfamily)